MFHPRNIADELAGIRSEIYALKRRERILSEVVLSNPDSHAGQHHEVVIKKQKKRVLMRDRLPAHILKNPDYWDEREEPLVVLRERDMTDVADLSMRRFFTANPAQKAPVTPRRASRRDGAAPVRPRKPVLRVVSPDA